MSIILYSGWLSQSLCEMHHDKLFVFGDNTRRFGMGGQAIIRTCDNAFGIPTKRKPAMTPGSFFTEGNEEDEDAVLTAIQWLWRYLREGKTIVIPVLSNGKPSLGLERAELLERAPSLYALICQHVEEMVDAYGSAEITTRL